jgi:hypothetical protein
LRGHVFPRPLSLTNWNMVIGSVGQSPLPGSRVIRLYNPQLAVPPFVGDAINQTDFLELVQAEAPAATDNVDSLLGSESSR